MMLSQPADGQLVPCPVWVQGLSPLKLDMHVGGIFFFCPKQINQICTPLSENRHVPRDV